MLKLDKKYGVCYTEYTSAYEYDCHGQLTGEAFTDADGKINITEVTYDTAGNIRTKGGKLYEYDSTWKDLLVKYDGKNIYYDALGNPTTYLGNVLTWTVGRKLETFGENISYKYNSLGHRITKTVGDTVHEYFYEGSRLVKEIRTDSDGTVHTLVFLYDASDSPIGMQYDGTAYYYKKNLQGDIIALLDADCKTIAEYIYDAWGALRTINADTLQNTLIAALNPIRYRGYYYDNETGFYFLQSRYYDPVVGRFLNADDTMFLGMSGTACSYNLFAYCENDPLNDLDIAGFISLNSILSKVKKLFDKLLDKFFEFVFSMLKFDKEKRTVSINTAAISVLIDVIIANIITNAIYYGTKIGMEILLKSKTIAKSFVGSIFDFFTNQKLGRSLFWILAKIAFMIAGIKGAFGTGVSGIIESFIANIIAAKSIVIQRISSIIGALSSIGGFIALFLDLADGDWDDYATLKFF